MLHSSTKFSTDPLSELYDIRVQGQFQILDLERMAQQPQKRKSYISLSRTLTVLNLVVKASCKPAALPATAGVTTIMCIVVIRTNAEYRHDT
jgi:hypothetical protein